MNRVRPAIIVFFVLMAYMVLSNTIVNLLANTGSFLRHDNRLELYEAAYEAKIADLEREIADYERAANVKIREGESLILAKIALRNIYDIYDYVIVSTPYKLAVGDVALNEDGLVGVVSEASSTTAKIKLTTGSGKTSVKVGENYGVLDEYDHERGEFVVHNIDNYKVVNEGDVVTTSGFQEIEGNIPVGVVTSVAVKGVEKIVRVKPYVDYDNLNYLFILAK